MREGPSWQVTVSPGTIRVRTRDPVRAERTHERQRRAARVNADAIAAWLADGDDVPEPGTPTRGTILAWTPKSRARLVARLGEKDYSRLYGRFLICSDCGTDYDDTGARRPMCPKCRSERHTVEDRSRRFPAMLTLTYPGDWLTVCPYADAVTEHFDTWTKRYKKAWGELFRGPWKREFQDREAPHLHVSTTPPGGRATIKLSPRTIAALVEDSRVRQKLRLTPVGGRVSVDFPRWLSISWAEVVNHPDEEQFRRHLLAGTGVDYAQGINLTDPRRMAVYFSKYGQGGSKEYQNQVPRAWLEAVATCLDCARQYDADLHECPDCGHPEAEIDYHGSAGRFWGCRHLPDAIAVRHVSPDTGITAGRVLRRWYAAKRLTKRVSRPRTDQATGRSHWRRTTVRKRLFRGNRGFVTVNDGSAVAAQLGGYLSQRITEQQRDDDHAELVRVTAYRAEHPMAWTPELEARRPRLPALRAAVAARRATVMSQ